MPFNRCWKKTWQGGFIMIIRTASVKPTSRNVCMLWMHEYTCVYCCEWVCVHTVPRTSNEFRVLKHEETLICRVVKETNSFVECYCSGLFRDRALKTNRATIHQCRACIGAPLSACVWYILHTFTDKGRCRRIVRTCINAAHPPCRCVVDSFQHA